MKTTIYLASIASITLLEIIALLKGINGIILMTSISLIAGLGGYHAKETAKGVYNGITRLKKAYQLFKFELKL